VERTLPFIDYSTGNSDSMIKTAEANLAMVTDKTMLFWASPVGGKTEMTKPRYPCFHSRPRCRSQTEQIS
jgi:hypothetical protein